MSFARKGRRKRIVRKPKRMTKGAVLIASAALAASVLSLEKSSGLIVPQKSLVQAKRSLIFPAPAILHARGDALDKWGGIPGMPIPFAAPGDDAPPPTPSLTNLWAWWSAQEAYTETSGTPTTLITADTTAIGSLKDLSGNGRHQFQVTAGNKPAHRTGIVNGLAAAQFVTNDFMTPSAIPALPVAIYCVVQRTTWGSLSPIVSSDVASPKIHLADHSSSPLLYLYNGNFGANVSMSNAANHIVAGLLSASSSTLRLDNGSDATAAVPGGGTGTTLYLGTYRGTNFWNGYIAEVLIYTATHTTGAGDGLLARQYLNYKYGIAI